MEIAPPSPLDPSVNPILYKTAVVGTFKLGPDEKKYGPKVAAITVSEIIPPDDKPVVPLSTVLDFADKVFRDYKPDTLILTLPTFTKQAAEYDEKIKANSTLMFSRGYYPLIESADVVKAVIALKEKKKLPEDLQGKFLTEVRRGTWRKQSVEQIKRHGEEEPDTSMILMMFGSNSDLLYPRSKRPRTTMQKFQLDEHNEIPLPKDYNPEGGVFQIELDTGEVISLFPVTRYAYGAKKGTYYTEESGRYCGTFYYWEPDSDVFLNLGNYEQHITKLHAARDLLQRLVTEEALEYGISSVTDHMISTFPFLDRTNPVYNQAYRDLFIGAPLDRDINWLPSHEYRHWQKIHRDAIQGDIDRLYSQETPRYLNIDAEFFLIDEKTKQPQHFIGYFYAIEDPLDQVLCKLGRQIGIDTFIFERMVGQQRLVTEVLDTRSREQSLDALIWRSV